VPDIFGIIRDINTSPWALIWIGLLIDSIFNKNLKAHQRFFWVVFIFCTQFFGAFLYFFYAPALANSYLFGARQKQASEEASTETATPASPMPQEAAPYVAPQHVPEYAHYEQGYHPQQQAVAHSEAYQAYDPNLSYDQPQAIYPEMTQEQKS
jgi:hypothetical protein